MSCVPIILHEEQFLRKALVHEFAEAAVAAARLQDEVGVLFDQDIGIRGANGGSHQLKSVQII